jgi:ABC-type nitrate/sulfonate/bicarbonate transport system substrate-binding protein
VDVLPGHAAPGLLNAIARGERIRMVAQRSRWLPADCSAVALVARPGLLPPGGSRQAAPRIRRISIDKQAAMLFFVEQALASVGASLDTLERVYVPHAAEGEALAAGDIDVALSGEPFMSRMLRARQAVPWIGQEDVLPGMEFSMVFFGRRLLERERDAGARFVAAYLEANQKLAAGKTARNLALVSEFLGESTEALAGICWPFQETDGRIRREYLMRFQDWARQRDLIDRVADPDELIDSGFLPPARE